MKPAFRDLIPDTPRVIVQFDGQDYNLRLGGNLAAELMAAGVVHFRKTAVLNAYRGPFCMMGACYDCLVQIDGVTQQACMTEVTEGLIVKSSKESDAYD